MIHPRFRPTFRPTLAVGALLLGGVLAGAGAAPAFAAGPGAPPAAAPKAPVPPKYDNLRFREDWSPLRATPWREREARAWWDSHVLSTDEVQISAQTVLLTRL